MIAKVYQVDPLVCTKCGKRMGITGFITDSAAIMTLATRKAAVSKGSTVGKHPTSRCAVSLAGAHSVRFGRRDAADEHPLTPARARSTV